MLQALKEDMKMVLAMALVILITQTLFFMAYGYLMSGDPYIALRNFYSIMYRY
jgi:hypothetical protein